MQSSNWSRVGLMCLQHSKPEKSEAAVAAEAPVTESSNPAAQWEHLGRPEDNYGVHTTISYSDGRYCGQT